MKKQCTTLTMINEQTMHYANTIINEQTMHYANNNN